MKENQQIKRTIESVLDLDTGKEVKSNDFFNSSVKEIFEKRYLLEESIQKETPRFVCYFCKQKVKIRGKIGGLRTFHFAHLKDSEDCIIKTDSKFTKAEIDRIKYNGVKEGDLHISIKTFIENILKISSKENKEVEQVEVEKVIKHQRISNQWRKPDVRCVFQKRKLVFEIQLFTTYLSVIAARQIFYQENQTFIIWVFHKFETEEDKRKFTQSDVFYNNNRNGFELDKESKMLSSEEGELILCCHYEEPYKHEDTIRHRRKKKYVKLSDLTFDEKAYKVYYFDVDRTEINLEKEIETEKASWIINKIKKESYEDLTDLFKRGVALSKVETNQINKLYAEFVENKELIDIGTPEFNIIWTVLLIKLNGKTSLIKKLNEFKVRKTVLDILGLKLNKIIGYNFKRMIQVTHRFFDTRPEFYALYMKAAKQYGRFEKLLDEDKSKKMQLKLSKLSAEQPVQDHEYDVIFRIFFPELF